MTPAQQTTVMSPAELRREFLLDPDITFLNHGSFGSCPRPVFDIYQGWQRELERQPVEFLGRRYHRLLGEVRETLGAFLGCAPDEVVLCDNATTGVNVIVRSLGLNAGDEVLTTDHEYGACDLTWRHLSEQHGVRVVKAEVDLPVARVEDVVEAIWSRVTPRTKVLYLSHITSVSALRLPVEELCRRAREAGIFSLIDGAHVPGHLPIDLAAIGADAYTGNLHKWLCAPKGAAFLHVRPEHHPWVMAPIVSWGWSDEAHHRSVNQLTSRNEWQGTRDPAAWLTVPAAIAYQADRGWDAVRARCRETVRGVRTAIAELGGLAPIAPDEPWWQLLFVACPVPVTDGKATQARLWDDHRIEVPFTCWRGRWHVRVSIQGYNDQSDVERLLEALRDEVYTASMAT